MSLSWQEGAWPGDAVRCFHASGSAGSDLDLFSPLPYPGLVRIIPPEWGGLLCNEEMTDTRWLHTKNILQLSSDVRRVRRSAGLILHRSVRYRGSA